MPKIIIMPIATTIYPENILISFDMFNVVSNKQHTHACPMPVSSILISSTVSRLKHKIGK